MADVNKKINLKVEAQGKDELKLVTKTMGELNAELERQTKIFEKNSGIVKQNASVKVANLQAQLGLLKQLQKEASSASAAEEKLMKQREKQWEKFRSFTKSPLKWTKDFLSPSRRLNESAQAKFMAGNFKGGMALGFAGMAVEGVVKAVQFIGDTFSKLTGISVGIKKNFTDILDITAGKLSTSTGMATYNAGTSLFMNAAARETQLRYGMTGSQAYAFTEARTLLGIKSDTDLLFMNESQRAIFIQYMQKQQQWYDKMESSGMLRNIQEMQLEMTLFKQEMSMEFLQWVGENKDTILNVAKGSLEVLKAILQGLSFLFGGLNATTYGVGSTTLADTVSAGTVNNQNQSRTYNVNVRNNVSGMFNENEIKNYLEEQFITVVRQAAVAMG